MVTNKESLKQVASQSVKPVEENKTPLPPPPASSFADGNLSLCDASSSANYESRSSEYSIIDWQTTYSDAAAMAGDTARKLQLTTNP